MSYTFTDGAVATKAQLDATRPGRLIQSGTISITPTAANTPTSVTVTFPVAFTSAPHIIATKVGSGTNDLLAVVAVANRTATSVDVVLTRPDTTATAIQWTAWVAPIAFTTGQPAYASLLNQSTDAPVAKSGQVTITPVANSPTSATVTFPTAFASVPVVLVGATTSVPGAQVKGVSVTAITTTGCKVWTTRTNTTALSVTWIAVSL